MSAYLGVMGPPSPARAVELAPTAPERFGAKSVMHARLRALGAPVPPGLAIDRETSLALARGEPLSASTLAALEAALSALDLARGAGVSDRPRLVSVRASPTAGHGAPNAILNVGLVEAAMPALTAAHGRRFALACRARLFETYAEALRPDAHGALVAARRDVGAGGLAPDEVALERLLALIPELYAGLELSLPPEEPLEQLLAALTAVARAEGETGCGLSVLSMVFGNLGPRSYSGSACSRDLRTGRRAVIGAVVRGAQGEGGESHRATPLALASAAEAERPFALELVEPALFGQLSAELLRVEEALEGPVTVELTIEEGTLWLVHAEPTRLEPRAELVATTELGRRGILSRERAIARVAAGVVEAVLDRGSSIVHAGPFARGLGASAGTAAGHLALSSEEVLARARRGEAAVLVLPDATPADLAGVRAAAALVTTRGGTTSDAAITARALGKPCVVSARTVEIDRGARRIRAGERTIEEGTRVIVDGARGELAVGGARAEAAPPELLELLAWIDEARRTDVLAIAHDAETLAQGRALGAHGVLVETCALLRDAGGLPAILRVRERGEVPRPAPTLAAPPALVGPLREAHPSARVGTWIRADELDTLALEGLELVVFELDGAKELDAAARLIARAGSTRVGLVISEGVDAEALRALAALGASWIAVPPRLVALARLRA